MRAGLEAPFVRDDAGTLRAALVVRVSPAIERLAPTQAESGAIFERAREQQDVLLARLKAAGVATTVLPDDASAPFGAACADAAVVFPAGAFLMRPSDLARRSEVAAIEAALTQLGVPVVGRIEAPGLLDGGDALLAPGKLFLGVPHARSSETGLPAFGNGNAHGRAQLARYARSAGLEVVEVALASAARRLRSVAALLDAKTVLVASEIVDASAFAGFERLDVPRGEDYGAGVLALGNRRVLANLRFRTLLPLLRGAKFGVDAIDLWEFGKAGATPSLLVLALKRT